MTFFKAQSRSASHISFYFPVYIHMWPLPLDDLRPFSVRRNVLFQKQTRWKHLFEDYFSATFLPNLLSLCLNHVFWLMQSRKKNRRPFPLLSFKNGKTASSFSRNWRVQMRFSCFSIYGTLTFVIWCMSTLVGLTVYVCLPYDLDPLSFKSDVMCPEKKTIEDCQNKSRPPWWYA